MSSQQYYQTSARHGEYQYISLKDIVNNFLLMNVGDDKIINDIPRYQVVHHAKRGIQELSYDALRETQKLEFELGSDLQIIMPEDFVQLTAASIVDEFGRLHPIIKNTDNAVPDAFLQDSSANYTFDANGSRQQTSSLAKTRMEQKQLQTDVDSIEDEHTGGRFGLETGSAEDYMYSYLQSEILDRKFGVQEYIVRRSKKSASAKLRNAKIKLMNINIDDLVQRFKGKNKWIK